MSINKKNFLATKPVELGMKDAVHVAIVSVRAAKPLNPGDHFTIDKNGEGIKCDPKTSVGVVSPFIDKAVLRGESFWGLLKLEEISSVQHNWSHPKFSFEAPKTEPSRNQYIQQYADELKVSYEQLMEACGSLVHQEQQIAYPGTLSIEEFEVAIDAIDDLWYEWASESLYEFENMGSECCPEMNYPNDAPFHFVNK